LRGEIFAYKNPTKLAFNPELRVAAYLEITAALQ
jgi:hypothetical protein